MSDNLLQIKYRESEITQVSDSLVTQNQGTSQTDINIQKGAVAIAQNGSYAVALQTACQENKNKQSANANAENTVNGSRWGAVGGHKSGHSDGNDNPTTASIVQQQYVEQANFSKAFRNREYPCLRRANFNVQPTAAIAVNGEDAPKSSVQFVPIKNVRFKKFIQRLKREANEEIPSDGLCVTGADTPEKDGVNEKPAGHNTVKPESAPCQEGECCTTVTERAAAVSSSFQYGQQRNFSLQAAAIAIAVGPGALARANQLVFQKNMNAETEAASTSDSTELPCCNIENTFATTAASAFSSVNTQNTPVKLIRMAIGLFGGDAEANQTAVQNNVSTNLASSEASTQAICGNQPLQAKDNLVKESKRDDSKASQSNSSGKATAKVTDMNEKAVIDINKGTLNLKIQITENGDLYINGKKLE